MIGIEKGDLMTTLKSIGDIQSLELALVVQTDHLWITCHALDA
jgi:hypothetical protein